MDALMLIENDYGEEIDGLNLTNFFASFGNETGLIDILSYNETFSLRQLLNETSSWNGTDLSMELFANITESSLKDSSNEIDPIDGSESKDHKSLEVSQHTFLHIFSSLLVLTFIYYIPRLFFFRVMRFSTEMNQPSFFPILVLSLVALSGSIFHIFNTFKNSFMAGTDKSDSLMQMIRECLCTSSNRIISPLVTLVVVQQMAFFSDSQEIKLVLKTFFEVFYIFVSFIIMFGFTFYNGLVKYENLRKGEKYREEIDLSLTDVVPQLIATVALILMKKSVARKQEYTADSGPDAPRTIDRVSKVIVFQQVMAVVAIASYFLRKPDELGEFTDLYTYFIAAQTPAVHWVLMKSLLRSKRSRKVCFLCCCTSEERVTDDRTAMEMKETKNRNLNVETGNRNMNGGSKPDDRVVNRNQQILDDDDTDEGPPADLDTQETVDHNMAVRVDV